MTFNYGKLRGRIVEIWGCQEAFAKAIGISTRTLSLKMTGKVGWKQSEICKAIDLLKLEGEDIPRYFFTIEVQNIEQLHE